MKVIKYRKDSLLCIIILSNIFRISSLTFGWRLIVKLKSSTYRCLFIIARRLPYRLKKSTLYHREKYLLVLARKSHANSPTPKRYQLYGRAPSMYNATWNRTRYLLRVCRSRESGRLTTKYTEVLFEHSSVLDTRKLCLSCLNGEQQCIIINYIANYSLWTASFTIT